MLKEQGDGPHYNKNLRSPVKATNYPRQLIIGLYQADITPWKRF